MIQFVGLILCAFKKKYAGVCTHGITGSLFENAELCDGIGWFTNTSLLVESDE